LCLSFEAVMSTNIKKKQWAHFYSITILRERRTLKDAIMALQLQTIGLYNLYIASKFVVPFFITTFATKQVTAHLKPDLTYKDTHIVSHELQKVVPK